MEERERLNIYQKLAKIRKIADVAKKTKAGYGYKYADLEEILPKVKAGMEKYGISLLPNIINSNAEQATLVNTKTDKQGKQYDQTSTEFVIRNDMSFVWVDDDTGNRLEIPWYAIGMQPDPSQAFGTALTYSERYFLITYFQIPVTEANPEDYRRRQKEIADAEDLETAKAIIEKFDEVLRIFLAKNQDKQGEIKAMVSKYVSNGDYHKIKSPELAAKLFEEFQSTYIKED